MSRSPDENEILILKIKFLKDYGFLLSHFQSVKDVFPQDLR